MAYTKEQLDKFKCAHCNKKFQTYPKPGGHGLPDEIPFVRGGIVSQRDVDAKRLIHFHGYVGKPDTCFEQAMAEVEHESPDLENEENWGVGPHEEHKDEDKR